MSNHTQQILPLVLILSFAVTAVKAEDAVPGNLAPNPGFEIADAAGPAFWSQRTASDSQRTLCWDAELARSGKRSLRVENREPVISRWRTGHLGDLTLAAGSAGTASAWIKTKDVSDGAYLRFYFIAADGEIIAQPQTRSVRGSTDWTQVELPLRVPDGTAYGMIYLELTGKGTAWFDDVVLTGTAGKAGVGVEASITYAAGDFDPVAQASPQPPPQRIEAIFWGDTARYRASVTYALPPGTEGRMAMRVNGKPVSEWVAGEAEVVRRKGRKLWQHTVQSVDLQQRSRLTLELPARAGEAGGRVIEDVTLTRIARFGGEFLPESALRLPPTLRLYQTRDDRAQARSLLGQYIGAREAVLWEKRNQELQDLKSPDAWRRRQEQTRARLPQILGDFGPKCPLNAKIVGTLDRPDYTIEKLIFESQPKYYCTANVYVPKRRTLPQPGILFTCGHAADGKAAVLYHEACLGMVLKGYVVLALDPMGQGERSEYFDPQTGQPLVPLTVSQHHYLLRPSWLVGRSLAGYRVWDCGRAVDYLVTRPEVDPQRIGVVGNSGGGIMALLATAADPRIKVCAAAHPGGSCEETYLTGQQIPKADLLGLIAPRPCLFIVGKDSGEEPGHRQKMEWMRPFYRGFEADDGRLQMVLVDGVHDMKQPKREPAYGWINRWFGKEEEGAQEPPLAPEPPEALRATATGFTLRDLGSESGQTINAALARQWRQPRPLPESDQAVEQLREQIRRSVLQCIGLQRPQQSASPPCVARGTFESDDFTAEKMLLESEPGIHLPALLLRPRQERPSTAILLHVSEEGKPARAAQPSLALELVRAGHTVLSLDARGAGEIDPRDRSELTPLGRYDAEQFRFDSLAVRAAQFGTTLLAMQTFDVLRALDYLASRDDLAGRPVVLVGEGLGGVWSLAAAALDSRPAGVVCVKTIPSYRLIVGSRYYACRDYFWVPGALRAFDIPDLAALVAPRGVAWLDAVDASLEPLDPARCRELYDWPRGMYDRLGSQQGLQVVKSEPQTLEGAAARVAEIVGGFTGGKRQR